MKEEKVFNYSYSAKQQEEVEAIKRKYFPTQEANRKTDKLEELRRLDKQVELTATIWSIIVGAIGTLVFGAGMSFILAFEEMRLVPGLIIGIIGMTGIAAALPVYRIVLKKQREKVAPKILALTEELLRN